MIWCHNNNNVARMKQFNNISLVHKSLSGSLSSAERAAYNEWLLQPENEKMAQDLQDVWDITADYQPTSFQPNAAAAFHKFKAQIADEVAVTEAKVVRLNPMRWVGRIAASFLLIAASVFLYQNQFSSNSFENEIFASTLSNSTLDDGSNIWLDGDASMAIATAFNKSERRVKLEGKAHFKVERDENKPFIVEMGENRLEVLGTSFNIDNTSEDVFVEVESGTVKVSTKNKVEILQAGDKATLNYNEDKITLGKTNASAFDWIKGSLNIEAKSVENVFKEMASFYNVDIDLSVNVDKACMLTSPLAENSTIDELFQVLSSTYQMDFDKINDKQYKIKFLNCK